MRNLLALLTIAVMLAFTTSAALAFGPSVDGELTQKFSISANDSPLIAVGDSTYAVPLGFYLSVQVGDTYTSTVNTGRSSSNATSGATVRTAGGSRLRSPSRMLRDLSN